MAGRNFCNKLWNISRYIEDKLADDYRKAPPMAVTMADHWIIKQLSDASVSVKQLVETYRFAEAAETIYQVVWTSLADWYIEASKHELNKDVLAWALDTTLRMSHPFAPFITETIWQTLPWYDGMLISATWPEATVSDEIAAAEFDRLREFISEVRFASSELPHGKIPTILYGNDSLIRDNTELIQRLTKAPAIQPTDTPRGLRLAGSGREAWLDLDSKTLYEHEANLEIRLAEQHKNAQTLRARLENASYLEKAPEHLVEESRKQLIELEALIVRLQNELTAIKN